MINAFLQARMSSSRLPGKVLKNLAGMPMLWMQVQRIRKANHINQVIVCTSSESSDDAIEEFCQLHQIDCFRGSLYRVLTRFADASSIFPSEHIVRLTADCPLSEPQIIDNVIDQHLEQKNEFTSNCNPYTLPDGLDVEVMSKSCFNKVIQGASTDDHYEHVTKYIYEHLSDFKVGNYRHSPDYSDHRWTVDYPEDFALVEAVLSLSDKSPIDIELADVVQILNTHPEVRDLNRHYIEN